MNVLTIYLHCSDSADITDNTALQCSDSSDFIDITCQL
jgi:hypothetical protein